MNFKPDQPHDRSSEPAGQIRQRCLAYLLGEMDEPQRAQFESQLDAPDVAEVLVQESQLLLDVVDACDQFPRGTQSVAASALPCSAPAKQPGSVTKATTSASRESDSLDSRTWRRAIMVAFALAATVLFAVVTAPFTQQSDTMSSAVQSQDERSEQFQLRLARVWVDPAVDWESESDTAVSDSLTAVEEIPVRETESPTDQDESLDWMVTAVRAVSLEGQPNDG
ncbi:hypothetical protein FYK55_09690 [Roseiconus nitratireducens]|uniref:Uncharacterized protein n=1 Tax=Roseiconus nitratireducens TaxID=2605748 RepID=A0A5M6DEH2_9BACT|nr:hypothetical protein [Roseiconus nitratireducens]KAA5544579.1 hypothetical protein FYK55_09690 [Roseiconus nitratireducens]